MKVCIKCLKEMTCIKTGKGVRFGDAHVYMGDAFKCPSCQSEIIVTASNAIHDPEHRFNTVQMIED